MDHGADAVARPVDAGVHADDLGGDGVQTAFEDLSAEGDHGKIVRRQAPHRPHRRDHDAVAVHPGGHVAVAAVRHDAGLEQRFGSLNQLQFDLIHAGHSGVLRRGVT